jgi:hypothetical protein
MQEWLGREKIVTADSGFRFRRYSAAATSATHSFFSMRRLFYAQSGILQCGPQFLDRGGVAIEIHFDETCRGGDGYLAYALEGLESTRDVVRAFLVKSIEQLQALGFHFLPPELAIKGSDAALEVA